ncbi:Expansin-YoaJ [Gracilariopsis chorda]|uniref:Expansin-YoaJ n=1 Tax=Gracilariopsis chorda TaxID=448386 RepID=A0A2V3ISL2_9FLOR|nr:Expansin-YoaJ [Gracilariopsis chorda]|eukprot:PXF45115.1 Expansin-YoaJ [Gracilariopsis chorda]
MNSPVILALALLLAVVANAMSPNDYYRVFHGEGTYYGYTTRGNCAIRSPMPSMYNGMLPVAINNAQYENSASCGACLQVTGYGQGSGANPIRGTFKAYVHDRCPECKYGDIDLSKGGDGRWRVHWKFIPCPGEFVFFLFEGSNRYYLKLQPRGLKTPVSALSVGGQWGTKTQDNFYIVQNGGGFRFPITVQMRTVLNEWITVQLAYSRPDGAVFPVGYTTGRARSQPPPRAQAAAPKPATQKCVPDWKPCTGPKNWWGTSNCCSGNYRCVKAGQANFVGRRCEPAF